MGLPPVEERRSDVLGEEIKRLKKLADELDATARDHKIPELTPLAERVREAADKIQEELARRAAA